MQLIRQISSCQITNYFSCSNITGLMSTLKHLIKSEKASMTLLNQNRQIFFARTFGSYSKDGVKSSKIVEFISNIKHVLVFLWINFKFHEKGTELTYRANIHINSDELIWELIYIWIVMWWCQIININNILAIILINFF